MLKKTGRQGLFILGLLGFVGSSTAYIPSYSMMLSALAKTHGRGTYRIEQVVTFQHSTDSLSLKERWWLSDSHGWRLDVQAQSPAFKDLFMRFIYKGNIKIFKDEQGRQQRLNIPIYHLDKPFHLRHARQLNYLFSLWKVAPFQKNPPQEEVKPWLPGSELFITLVPRHGMVQYRVSTLDSILWLEQDEFVIREWLWADRSQGTKAHLLAWDYVTYPGALLLPTWRRFRWSHSEVCIQVQSVRRISPHRKWFQTKQLSQNRLSSGISPSDQDRIREFYRQFR